MAQHIRKIRESRENVLSFGQPSEPELGSNALNLVYQAAEIFSDMEARARDTEARAQSMCKVATERMLSAEERSAAADRARRQIITEVECKLQDASRALKQAELKITTAQDRATAAELRAAIAEARTREAVEALALVEEALRSRFGERAVSNKLSAVA